MTIPVVAAGPAAVAPTVEVLRSGGMVVLPTDTVYGVAALPTVEGATGALFAAKDRRSDVPLAVLCATAEDAFELADMTRLEASARARANAWADAHWPGPLTMVLPRRADLGWDLGEPAVTVGVRVPDHDFIRAVAAQVGPIAVTSANRHGEATPPEAEAAAESLVVKVGLIVDGGRLDSAASTVVDVARGEVLRQGPIHLDIVPPEGGRP